MANIENAIGMAVENSCRSTICRAFSRKKTHQFPNGFTPAFVEQPPPHSLPLVFGCPPFNLHSSCRVEKSPMLANVLALSIDGGMVNGIIDHPKSDFRVSNPWSIWRHLVICLWQTISKINRKFLKARWADKSEEHRLRAHWVDWCKGRWMKRKRLKFSPDVFNGSTSLGICAVQTRFVSSNKAKWSCIICSVNNSTNHSRISCLKMTTA